LAAELIGEIEVLDGKLKQLIRRLPIRRIGSAATLASSGSSPTAP